MGGMEVYSIGFKGIGLEVVGYEGKTYKIFCHKCGTFSDRTFTKKQVDKAKGCGECKYKRYIGKTLGNLTVLGYLGVKDKKSNFKCLCVCGNLFEKDAAQLSKGKILSCGCIKGTYKDIAGNRSHKLTAVRNTYNLSTNGDYLWECLCDCGNTTVVTIGAFNSGGTKSCGCALGDAKRSSENYHGLTKTTEYNSWRKMRERCNSENCKDYKNYGARGISYCKSWENFKTFLKDMGHKPEPTFTLDRIDGAGNYSKSNCRWASPCTQARNQRGQKGVTSKYKGVHKRSDGYWAAKITVGDLESIIGITKSEVQASGWYNTATKLIFENALDYTHLREDSLYEDLNPESRFVKYWLPLMKTLRQELYE